MGEGRQIAMTGLTVFAAFMMLLTGIWGFFSGLAAIVHGDFFVVGGHYIYKMSATGWGWIHLIIGIAVAAAGAGLLAEQWWARLATIVVVMVQAITQFLFIPYYPFWSILVIALDVFVLWALMASSPERDRTAGTEETTGSRG